MGVNFGKLKKKFWFWKWTFGSDQQEHVEGKRLEMKYLEKNDYKNTILDDTWPNYQSGMDIPKEWMEHYLTKF
jgi:hypothetical protein